MDHVQKSLLEVKAYYVSLLGDYELKIAHVKKQILHVEALLPDFLPPLSLQMQDERRVLKNEGSLQTDHSTTPTDNSTQGCPHFLEHIVDPSFPQSQIVSDQFGDKKMGQPSTEDFSTQADNTNTRLPHFFKPDLGDIVDAIIDAEGEEENDEDAEAEYGCFDHNKENELLFVDNTSTGIEFPQSILDASIDTSVIPELPANGDYRRIYSIFQENKEKILHFQYILSSVYQPQHTHTFALKRKLRSELDYGVKRGFWNKVADEQGCYQARFGD